MTVDELDERTARIVGTVLGKSVGAGDALSKADESAWDSIKHIELIMTLEQEFDVLFDPADIPRLTSLAALTEKIRFLLGR